MVIRILYELEVLVSVRPYRAEGKSIWENPSGALIKPNKAVRTSSERLDQS